MIKREKKEWIVITFKTTNEALKMEAMASNAGLKGRIIPVPIIISSGCGLAWRNDISQRDIIKDIMVKSNIKYNSIEFVMI